MSDLENTTLVAAAELNGIPITNWVAPKLTKLFEGKGFFGCFLRLGNKAQQTKSVHLSRHRSIIPLMVD